ncbi:hypothetical protein WME88_33580 [Sorangium sp. So ce216]
MPIEDLVAEMRARGVPVEFRSSNVKAKKKPTKWTGGSFFEEGTGGSGTFVGVTAIEFNAYEKKQLASRAATVHDDSLREALLQANSYYSISLPFAPDPATRRLALTLADVISSWCDGPIYDSAADRYFHRTTFAAANEELERAAPRRASRRS